MDNKSKKTAALILAISVLCVSYVVFMLGSENQASSNSEGYNAHAETVNDSTGHDKIVSVQGKATTSVKPDLLNIRFGVETQAETAQSALESNSIAMNKIVSDIKLLRISEDEISTSSLNIHPVYDSINDKKTGRYSQELVGYRVSNVILVDTAKIDSAASIIDTAVKAGANRVDSIHFSISPEREQKIRDELLEQAVLNAKSKAEKLISPLDHKITGVKSISLSNFAIPYRMDTSKAFALEGGRAASTPIFSGENDITATANIVFLIEEENNIGTG